jgi:hypothetical protein
VPEDSVTTAARPSATRRGGGWWWVGAALAGVLAAVLVVVLVRSEGDRAPTQVTADPARAQLEREAVAAVHNWVEATERTDETGDESALDGVFVPGSELDGVERKEVRLRAHRYLTDPSGDDDIVDLKVIQVTVSSATVTGLTTHKASVLRDRKTGQVLRRGPAYTRSAQIQLDRVNGRWLVAHVQWTGPPAFKENG